MSPFSAAVIRADIFLSVAGKCLGDLGKIVVDLGEIVVDLGEIVVDLGELLWIAVDLKGPPLVTSTTLRPRASGLQGLPWLPAPTVVTSACRGTPWIVVDLKEGSRVQGDLKDGSSLDSLLRE